MRAAVAGMAEGAAAAGAPAPCVLGVTVLTSDTDATPDMLVARSKLAAAAGCGGIVCAASDLAVTRRGRPGARDRGAGDPTLGDPDRRPGAAPPPRPPRSRRGPTFS